MKNLNTLILAIATLGLILTGCKVAETLTPAQQGEVEIIDLLNKYKKKYS